MGKKFSELERTSSLNNGDLFAVAQVDAQAQTGYKSKSTEASAVAQKLLKGIEFPTDLQTDDKTVLGAINEVNSRTIAYDVVSGPIANFKTSLELPIKSLGIDVNAAQESGTPTPAAPLPISGRSEIKAVHTGKNLITANVPTNREYWETSQTDIIDALNTLPVGTYTISNKYKINELPSNGKVDHGKIYITAMVNGTQVPLTTHNVITDNSPYVGKVYQESGTFTITEANKGKINHAYLYCDQSSTHSGTGRGKYDFYDLQLELGSVETDYEPYVSNEYTISLGGTYYGGHFTQDKDGHRQFEVISRIASYTGESGEAWMMFTVAQGNLFRIQASDRKDGYITENNCKCNSYRPITQAQRTNETVSGTGLQLDFINNNFSSVEDWKTNLADNPIQIVYELATPFTIDLPDGNPIITLNGTNNIYADSGDASVEYALTIEEYINKKIAEVQALILNS